MANEPVTLEQIKQHLRLEIDENEQDTRLKWLMVAARSVVEEYIKRDIVATWPTVTARQRIIAAQAITLMVEEWFMRGAEGTVPDSVVRLLKLIRIPRI